MLTLGGCAKSHALAHWKGIAVPLTGPTLPGPADLADLLAPALSDKPDEIALASATDTWTWRELERDINALAAQLVTMGLRPGDRVASLMPNRCELLLYDLACLKAGLVVTPLNYRYTAPEIDHALSVSEASILLAHAERADDVRASDLAGKLRLGLIAFGGPLDRAARLEDLIKRDPPDVNLPKPDPMTPGFLFFTSGSTGKPKGVTHTLSSFGYIAASFAQAMATTKEDVVLPGGSVSHVGALSTAMAGLSVGARVVVARTPDGDEILPLLRQWRPSILVMLPSAMIALQRDHGATPEDFGSLRLCITGGDKFPANLEKEFTDLTGLPIKEAYGLTEATDCLFDTSSGTAKAGSAGVVCPGYTVSLRDDNGQEVPADTDGRLWLKGPPVMSGYWNNPEATEAVFDDGWFDTGDVMQLDADGYFWFRGRKKQIIVHDSSNIAPQEIEEAVMAHPAVDLAGVVGVHDTVHGENVWAYVSLKDGVSAPRAQDIIQCARERVGYKAPEVVIFLDKMPMNATDKVDRMTLKKWAADRVSAEHPA